MGSTFSVVNMNRLLVFLCALTSALALPKVKDECQNCQQGVEKLFGNYVSQEGLAYQREILYSICSDPIFDQVACDIFQTSSWDCDTCQRDIDAVAQGYSSDAGIKGIVDALQGPNFCEDPNFFEGELVARCKELLPQVIPLVMRALTGGIEVALNDICKNWFDNICS